MGYKISTYFLFGSAIDNMTKTGTVDRIKKASQIHFLGLDACDLLHIDKCRILPKMLVLRQPKNSYNVLIF